MSENQPLLGARLEGKTSVQEDESSGAADSCLWEVRLPQGKTSPWGAVFIIINAALGAGLLAFPVAFYSAGGILPALLVMMFLLVWIVVGLLVLAHLAENLQAATFEDVVGRACGPVVKAVVDGCIIVYTFGTCIAFLVVIGDQLQDLSSAVHIHGKAIAGEWWVNRKLLISLSALLFILPWLWMKRIGVLSLTRYWPPYTTCIVHGRHQTPLQCTGGCVLRVHMSGGGCAVLHSLLRPDPCQHDLPQGHTAVSDTSAHTHLQIEVCVYIIHTGSVAGSGQTSSLLSLSSALVIR
jgi:hypothetical protein